MVADLQLISGRTLDIVTRAVAKGAYGSSIAADYGRFTVAAAMTETAEKLTDADAESGTAQYNLTVGALAALSRSDHAQNLSRTPISCARWPLVDGRRALLIAPGAASPGCTRPLPHHWVEWCVAIAALTAHRPRRRKPWFCSEPSSPGIGASLTPRIRGIDAKQPDWWPVTCNGIWNAP